MPTGGYRSNVAARTGPGGDPTPPGKVAATVHAVPVEPFICPRCGGEVTERFYGPCSDCRAQLVDSMAGAAREVAPAQFEPRPNVVANHVATKD